MYKWFLFPETGSTRLPLSLYDVFSTLKALSTVEEVLYFGCTPWGTAGHDPAEAIALLAELDRSAASSVTPKIQVELFEQAMRHWEGMNECHVEFLVRLDLDAIARRVVVEAVDSSAWVLSGDSEVAEALAIRCLKLSGQLYLSLKGTSPA